MQSPQIIYCIDTGSLINPWHKIYQPDMFITIWNDHLPALFESGQLVSSRQVLIEIEKQEDDLCNWCRDRKEYFEEVDAAVIGHVTMLMDRYQRLTTAGRNEADPFVVALAMARTPHLTVVAEEGSGMPNTRTQNIPFLCQQHAVRCITFNTLLRETGWREGGRRV
jgi:hypothetical protein